MTDQPVSPVISIRLKKREQRRIDAGHMWVFSNEIDTAVTPIKGLTPGSAVHIESATGKFLAHGYINPASLIAARVTSRNKSVAFSSAVVKERIRAALMLREALYEEPFYRLVHSEGDFLPGLVVDRYGDIMVVQITTAGMENFCSDVVEFLVEELDAKAVCLKNDNPVRELEALPQSVEWIHGAAPDELQVRENGLNFVVPSALTQKTGWFYDHRDSRVALRNWVKGKRVLDLYSYIGGFGINAAVAGAEHVLSVDASAAAIEAANNNAQLNSVGANVDCQTLDAVEAMRSLYSDNERFDVIVLDPPAFIKRKKDRDAGARHYALNMRLALRLLKENGVLLSASCSQAFSMNDLQQALRLGTPKGSLGVQIINTFQQAPDHPVNVAMAETLYLKGVIARLT